MSSKKKASSKKKKLSSKTSTTEKSKAAKTSKEAGLDAELDREISALEEDLIGSRTATSIGKKPITKPTIIEIEEAEGDEEEDDGSDWEVVDRAAGESEEEESDSEEETAEEDGDLTSGEDEPGSEEDSGPDVSEEDDTQDEEDDASVPKEIPNEQKDLLVVYNKNCLNCAYLVAHKTNFFEDCHYLTGNDRCPAAGTRIAIGVPVEKAARAIARAWLQRDLQKFNRLSNKLRDKDPLIVSRVMDRVDEYRASGKVPEDD